LLIDQVYGYACQATRSSSDAGGVAMLEMVCCEFTGADELAA